MSLVGTRPILPDELEQYELHHRARIAIKTWLLITKFYVILTVIMNIISKNMSM